MRSTAATDWQRWLCENNKLIPNTDIVAAIVAIDDDDYDNDFSDQGNY